MCVCVCVCVCVCLSVCPRGYLQNHTRDLYLIFVHVTCVRGSILLRHVYGIGRIAYRRKGIFFPIENALSPGKGVWQCTARANMLSTIALFCVFERFVMVALCNRADHYIFILFLSSSSFFFPRLISAVGDWMFTILWHMVWP